MEGKKGFNTSERTFAISLSRPTDQTPFPRFSKPNVIGCFSTKREEYVEGTEYLKFCKIPPLNPSKVQFDLNICAGKHKYCEESENLMLERSSELVHILEWIQRNELTFKQR